MKSVAFFIVFRFANKWNATKEYRSKWSWTCLRVTQQSGLSTINPPSRKSAIARNEHGFLSLHILLRFQQPPCLFSPKQGHLVIMTPLFSNQGWSYWSRNCWMTWLDSLKDDHGVPKRSMTREKNLLNVLCEMYHCSQVDLCHLKLNSNQGSSGREAWIPGLAFGMLCIYILTFSSMHFCSGTFCAVEAFLFYGISFLVWFLTKLCD